MDLGLSSHDIGVWPILHSVSFKSTHICEKSQFSSFFVKFLILDPFCGFWVHFTILSSRDGIPYFQCSFRIHTHLGGHFDPWPLFDPVFREFLQFFNNFHTFEPPTTFVRGRQLNQCYLKIATGLQIISQNEIFTGINILCTQNLHIYS